MSLREACGLATLAFAVHVFEEYILGWMRWVRTVSGSIVRPTAFWIVNTAAVLLGAVSAAVAPHAPGIALAFPAVLLINATFFHLGAFLRTRGKFSPGLITSLLLFYPAGIWCYLCAHRAGVLGGSAVAESILLGAIFMAVPLVVLRAPGLQVGHGSSH